MENHLKENHPKEEHTDDSVNISPVQKEVKREGFVSIIRNFIGSGSEAKKEDENNENESALKDNDQSAITPTSPYSTPTTNRVPFSFGLPSFSPPSFSGREEIKKRGRNCK